jgi:hypothetical protein
VDAGPRVLRFSASEESNLFYSAPASPAQSFQPIGGHRLWIAPENEATYYADNHPVERKVDGDEITFLPPAEEHPEFGIQKELAFSEGADCVIVQHRVSNIGATECTIAPWAITMMQGGGVAVLPLTERAPHDNDHLLPNSQLAVWSYTDFGDSRWSFLRNHLALRHEGEPTGNFPMQKTGLFHSAGWLAYVKGNDAFVKLAPTANAAATYPDRGCNLETFTNSEFLELETLGPLVTLRPGEQVSHAEMWKSLKVESPREDIQQLAKYFDCVAATLRQGATAK